MGGNRNLFLTSSIALCLAASAAHAVLPLQQIENFQRLANEKPSVLRLYFMPTAPVKLKWTTPRALLLSTVEAIVLDRSHPIGHVNVEVQLRGQDDADHHVMTGATDAGNGMSRQLLLKDEVGFSILERAWPGTLETPADMDKSIVDRAKYKDRLAVVTFLISDATAQRMLDYSHKLLSETSSLFYGFTARPRREEGSGCSAFGASYVELMGLMDDDLKAQWCRNVRVPLSLMAGYGHDKINIAKAVCTHAASAWALPTEPHMALQCFDPDLMFDWTVGLHDKPAEFHGLAVHTDPDLPRDLDAKYHLNGIAEKNVKAILSDARDVPTPTDPIFQGPRDLDPIPGTSLPTVIRGHKVLSADGSFDLKP